MPPQRATARRLTLVWGVSPVLCHDVMDVTEMTEVAVQTVMRLGQARPGESIVIAAGMPFGSSGSATRIAITPMAAITAGAMTPTTRIRARAVPVITRPL